MKQLQVAIQQSIKKHMKSYPCYLEKAKKLYPNKIPKFIFVVEDQSEAIINEDGLGILSIQELVSPFLEYEFIDAVISYNTSTRGDFIEARDRKMMSTLYPGLTKIEECVLISVIKEISIRSLSISEWRVCIERLMSCIEKMGMTDSVVVIKNENDGCDTI